MNYAVLILLCIVLLMTIYNEIQIRKISRILNVKLNCKIKGKDLIVSFDRSKKAKSK